MTDARVKYGFSYLGGKSCLADKIIDVLPAADYFVDLFAGGLAMTHAAAASGKYRHVISNDIQGLGVAFLREAEKIKLRFVTNEQFKNDSSLPRILKSIYSFGRDCRTYFCTYDEALPTLFNALVYEASAFQYKVKSLDSCYLRKLTGYQDEVLIKRIGYVKHIVHAYNSLIHRARRIKNDLRDVCFYTTDYRSIRIPENAVVYADAPYIGAVGYGVDFDHRAFYAYLRHLRQGGGHTVLYIRISNAV